MPEIDLTRVDQCVADAKLADDCDPSPPIEAPGSTAADSNCLKKKKSCGGRRGRPPRTLGKASPKRREDEDVCFVCFDGGSLVLCDRR